MSVDTPDSATPVRLLLVGTGNISGAWLRAIETLPGVELTAVADPRTEVALAKLADFGLRAPVEPELTTALARHDIDVVANLTPPALHGAVIAEALHAGRDVFSEKPLSTSLTEAYALADLAAETGRTISVMQNRRYAPAIRALRARVAAGQLGRISALSADHWMSPHHDAPYLNLLPHPLLEDMSLHTFDQARFLTGAEAVRVLTHEYNPRGSWYHAGGGATSVFELSDGSVFSYRGNWATPGFATSYDAAWRLSGEQGTAIWDSWSDHVRTQTLDQIGHGDGHDLDATDWPAETGPDQLRGHTAALAEMVTAWRQGRPAETSIADNLGTLSMQAAAIASAERGIWVEVAEIVDEARASVTDRCAVPG
ncbi:MAG: Gfo/Idh/MocA family oxidoreductase [Microlunatus sp.]